MLVGLVRVEAAEECLGGHAMLNGLAAALLTLTLRLATEATEAPEGLLALVRHPRLAPALSAMFRHPDRKWTLPGLATLLRHVTGDIRAVLSTSPRPVCCRAAHGHTNDARS